MRAQPFVQSSDVSFGNFTHRFRLCSVIYLSVLNRFRLRTKLIGTVLRGVDQQFPSSRDVSLFFTFLERVFTNLLLFLFYYFFYQQNLLQPEYQYYLLMHNLNTQYVNNHELNLLIHILYYQLF